LRPDQSALKMLTNIKRRYLKRCNNVAEVVEKLWASYQEQHERSEPTEDLNLLEITACPTRFNLGASYFCAWNLPNRKPRKLKSLKECEICLAKNKKKIRKVALEKAGIDLRNVIGRGQEEKFERLKRYAQKLAEGTYKKHCELVGKGLKLFDLPCVVRTNNFEKPFNCPKNPDCEALIKQYVKVLYFETI